MGLPSKAKTWNWTSNQVSTFSSVRQCSKDILFGYKTVIAAMSGASIKGSSVGATISMDSVDRWTSSTVLGAPVTGRATNGCTWIAFTLSNMGVELLLAFVQTGSFDNQCLIIISPTGSGFTVSNTKCPTATLEASFSATTPDGANFHSSTASGNRIWSIATTSDGTGIFMLAAHAGAAEFLCGIQSMSPTVTSPATFSPSAIIFANTSGASISINIASFFASGGSNSYNGAAIVNGGTGSGNTPIVALFGSEAYGTSISATTRLTFAPELQGGGNLLPEISVWSESATARGKLGYLVDCWLGFISAANGDTYPNDTSRQFLQWGVWAIPWDSSVVVLI